MGLLENFTYSQKYALIDLIFPPQCAGCGRPGERWCDDCSKNIKELPSPSCVKCGDPLFGRRSTVCKRCAEHHPPYEHLYTLSSFAEPLRSALLRLKYYGDKAIGENIAAEMAARAAQWGWNVDVIVPVPISEEKRKARGYNQVECISGPLAKLLGAGHDRTSLIQIKENKSQVGLNVAERRANVSDVFEVVGDGLRDKRVLLVDDTTTTGATLDFASRALFDGGAANVICVTAAKALIQKSNNAIVNLSHSNPNGM